MRMLYVYYYRTQDNSTNDNKPCEMFGDVKLSCRESPADIGKLPVTTWQNWWWYSHHRNHHNKWRQ